MKEQLQLLGKYLGHGVKVMVYGKEEELTPTLLTVCEIVKAPGQYKPILYGFDHFLKKREDGKALYHDFANHLLEGYGVGEPYWIDNDKRVVLPLLHPKTNEPIQMGIAVFKSFAAVNYVTKLGSDEEKYPTPIGMHDLFDWFRAHHFAVGLEEDQYIRKTA